MCMRSHELLAVRLCQQVVQVHYVVGDSLHIRRASWWYLLYNFLVCMCERASVYIRHVLCERHPGLSRKVMCTLGSSGGCTCKLKGF